MIDNFFFCFYYFLHEFPYCMFTLKYSEKIFPGHEKCWLCETSVKLLYTKMNKLSFVTFRINSLNKKTHFSNCFWMFLNSIGNFVNFSHGVFSYICRKVCKSGQYDESSVGFAGNLLTLFLELIFLYVLLLWKLIFFIYFQNYVFLYLFLRKGNLNLQWPSFWYVS